MGANGTRLLVADTYGSRLVAADDTGNRSSDDLTRSFSLKRKNYQILYSQNVNKKILELASSLTYSVSNTHTGLLQWL